MQNVFCGQPEKVATKFTASIATTLRMYSKKLDACASLRSAPQVVAPVKKLTSMSMILALTPTNSSLFGHLKMKKSLVAIVILFALKLKTKMEIIICQPHITSNLARLSKKNTYLAPSNLAEVGCSPITNQQSILKKVFLPLIIFGMAWVH